MSTVVISFIYRVLEFRLRSVRIMLALNLPVILKIHVSVRVREKVGLNLRSLYQ